MAANIGPRARERALEVAADVARRIQVELTQSAESVELPPMRGKNVGNLRKLYSIGSKTADVALQASCARLSMAGVTLTWQTRKKCVAVAGPSMPPAPELYVPTPKRRCRESTERKTKGGRPRGVQDEVSAAIQLSKEIQEDLENDEESKAHARLATKAVRERFSVGSDAASRLLQLARARLSMAGLEATRIAPRAKILVYRKPQEKAAQVRLPKLAKPPQKLGSRGLRQRLEERKKSKTSRPLEAEVQVISSDEEETKPAPASPERPPWRAGGGPPRVPASVVSSSSVEASLGQLRFARQPSSRFARYLSKWLQWAKKLRRLVRKSRSMGNLKKVKIEQRPRRKPALKRSVKTETSKVKAEHVKPELRAKRSQVAAAVAPPVRDFSIAPKRAGGNRKTGQAFRSATPSTLCVAEVPGWLMRVVLYAGGDAMPVACAHRKTAWSMLRDSRQVSSELRALALRLGMTGDWEPADQQLLQQMQRVVRALSALMSLEGPDGDQSLGPRRRLRLCRDPERDIRQLSKRVKQEDEEESFNNFAARLSSASCEQRQEELARAQSHIDQARVRRVELLLSQLKRHASQVPSSQH